MKQEDNCTKRILEGDVKAFFFFVKRKPYMVGYNCLQRDCDLDRTLLLVDK